VSVPVLHPAADVCLQLLDAVVMAAFQEVFGDEGEQPLHLVEPAGIRWSEVHLEPGMSGEPRLHDGTLMGAVVVADEVNVQVGGDFLVDLGEEPPSASSDVNCRAYGASGPTTRTVMTLLFGLDILTSFSGNR